MRSATFKLDRLSALRLAVTAAVTGALLGGGSTALQHQERQLTFHAVSDAADLLSRIPDGVQEFDLPVKSDAAVQRIHAWWWPASVADAPAVLYLHGASSDLMGQVFRLEQLRGFGFSVLAIDYRGFGKSDGDLPSEDTVYEDARAAWSWLIARQPDTAKRFIYGHSLGGAVAIDLAAALSAGLGGHPNRGAAAGLIVESSFTTLLDIAKEFSYPWLPVGLLMSQKFDSVSKMSQVRMPVLVVHGSDDRYVPSRFGMALYAAATGPKKLLLVEGADHDDSMLAGAMLYRRALAELFGVGKENMADAAARALRGRNRAGS
ncbi:MAG TPA: alpha/beta fold hydrolase [Casimicrobiaceae bacterium]|nr:alpha/beta fold hydrolase [Casimicrobiaceae bacterium]